jgi:hypothetical protein
MSPKFEKMYARADAIQERRANGLWEPIFWHMAIRGNGLALLRLSDWHSRKGTRAELGRFGDAFSPLGMMYRAFRKGERFAGSHMAMSYFNIGDLAGYRHWLAKAAKAGDDWSAAELKRFETRKPHGLAKKIGRLRPVRPSDF